MFLTEMSLTSIGTGREPTHSSLWPSRAALGAIWLGRSKDHRVISVRFDMLLEILRTLEGLATKVTPVRLEWDVDTDVGGDMIALDSGRLASTPVADQLKVVGALTTDMALADVILVLRSGQFAGLA